MANTWCDDAARELLGYCLRGEIWPRSLLSGLLHRDCSGELFRVVAEGLADRFDPDLCDTYAQLFSEALALAEPELSAEKLLARYRRIRNPRKFGGGAVRNVFVLSRVTLGADVAITSVILDAAKQRFPDARIYLAGSRKTWELFEADAGIEHLEVSYPRSGSLRERLDAWRALRRAVSQPDSITIDPDSRLTQLGLAPVCRDENYYFFESRSYGGEGDESLGTLTRRWVSDTFGIDRSGAYIAPRHAPARRSMVTISLGVGENPAKRIDDPFERELLRALVARGASILIDKGAGGDEAARAEAAIAGLPADRVQCWDGAFAPFAAQIACSDMYVGYDSAGQHVAAACGVPLVSVFAGFPSPRMAARWRPTGAGRIEVVRVENGEPGWVLEQVLRAIDLLALR
ncbi:MAG TPA: glycosyltransferase family 9 protein [Candidatus Solibacter sp.]|nr:glycosyltransferase family 9 protein [Candidatus Solibacter sp.]